jgi:hypothetical protein
MRIGYFDCFSGASGDMILGALVSAGLSPDTLRAELAKLRVQDYELEISQIRKQGFAATKVHVKPIGRPGARHLRDITRTIDDSDLSTAVKDLAKKIFTSLGEAEAKVHGVPVEEVHFHEVGAVDAIVDIVGAAIGIEQLGLERIVCSPIPTGSGTVRCDHGVLPIPAPATAELLTGVPIAACDEVGELTTPTGAAVLTAIAHAYGPLPAMRMERCGIGAGTREGRERPNLLRLFVGQVAEDVDQADEVVILEANLDDATGEQIGHAFEALFRAGALDVYAAPITMKKNRPGVLLSVLAPPDKRRACEDVLFAETPTFGVRSHVCSRRKLARSTEVVATRFGDIRVKTGLHGDQVVSVSPEYEDCARAARAAGVALREVMSEARHAWQAKHRTAKT